ncbi:gliding motility-associated C-terminal domain-containing protein [Pontibacter sp. BT310]|uniref:Gliding motility-associated C-terminal domain-containing protein n=1 Tax=Pontibacter populi TaxID=890055 RepID=A0ABS6XH59_9BACT|nr:MULTISPECIES: gliding motility-associated C-terminal domain-containing protein [Pontibacter]MBJ6119677.1 gliding motility-associated C-terminal domain-containing protein [Pontibacter sp. BT310]MBR0572106.1 gliding motility-associated C-terminal domain-containing protein [Microvirga sp. STS03]MBW3366530.1 gliding motility-associated C-terminal domain-containing protein [Pontibacter populi]
MITVSEINLPVVDLGPDQIICQGSGIQLRAPVGAYTYKWSTGATTPSINVASEGNYWVQVTNTSSCTSTDNISIQVVPKPIVNLASLYQICPGEAITLNATTPGATYYWSTGAKTPTIDINSQGTYWVDITVNNCTFRYNTTVNYKALPSFSISGPTQFCETGTITLSVPDVGSIQWSNGATASSITVNEGGKYTVQTIVDGCTLRDEIVITRVALPTFSLGADLSICKGEKVILTAPANMKTYKWSTGATTPTIEVTSAGTYWAEITNSTGCSYRDEIIITQKQEPTISLPEIINACYGEIVTLNATTQGATYTWSNGQTSALINVTAPIDLSVKITVDGCEYERQIKVLSDECPIIPNIITPNNDGKNDTFVISGLNIDNIDIEIFNRWGKSIYKRMGYDNNWATESTGIYYYHIKSRLTQKDYKGWVEVVQ